MSYLAYIIVCVVFFLIYKFLYWDKNRFTMNRGLLLIIPIVSLLIVLSPSLNNLFTSEITNSFIGETTNYIIAQTIPLDYIISSKYNIFILLYIIGTVVSLSFILFKYYKIFKTLNGLDFNRISLESNLKIAISKEYDSFSFFNFIHINESQKGSELVIEHEIQHALFKHSIDLLIVNIYKVVFWFNPIVYAIESELKLTHEFQVDETITRKYSKIDYTNCLLNTLFGTNNLQFVNQFFGKKIINKRIKMMNKKKEKSGYRSYFFMIPVVLLMLIVSSAFKTTPIVNQTTNNTDISSYNGDKTMPEFPGGMDALIEYLGDKMDIPEACDSKLSGSKINIEFEVSKHGEIQHVKALNFVDEDLNALAVKVISEMPNWIPGEIDGKKASIKMVLPLVFEF